MLLRQGVIFVVVGVAQVLIDWLLFSVLFWVTGAVSWPNVVARAGAALAGFQLHGRFTFATRDTTKFGRGPLLRYVGLWLGMTALSTLSMEALARASAEHWVYLGKPAVELALAALSFVISRQWVFR